MKRIGHGRKAKLYRRIVAAFLVICLFVAGELREYAPIVAKAKEKYVSSIRLFYALDSMQAAINKCKSSGFIPVESDLNAGTGKNHVVMGYQETNDVNDAICSIKLLSQGSGYDMKDYEELEKQYKSTNAAVIDTIEAAATEFVNNYEKRSPKAIEAYEGLNLIEIPEEKNIKLGDYIVQKKADWDFYAKVVTRASAGTTSAIISFLSMGISSYKNVYESGKKISVSWAEQIEDSPVWDDLEDAVTEDDYDELYMEYGDDAREFHKRLQEFATGYEDAMAQFDEDEYAETLETCKGKSEEDIVDDKEKMDENERCLMYIGIYEKLDEYMVNDSDTLADYLLDLGRQKSSDVNLTMLYPVIDSMTYAQRRISCMSGLVASFSTVGENKTDEDVEEKISDAAAHIKDLVGRDSYSIWMNNNEEIKGKKVAYTSDAVRTQAAQDLLDSYDTTSWEEKANEVMKWVNLALGVVSCVLILAKFTVVAYVLALIPAAISALLTACGLTVTAVTLKAMATAISGAASAAANPAGWIVLAVLVISMLVIWAVSEIQEYIKENKDWDYDPAPDYVADLYEGKKGQGLIYYKAAGSEMQPSDKYKGKKGNESEEKRENYHGEAGISDVNGRMGFRGWNCIFYSKDENIGSPIVIRDGASPFMVVTGDGGNLRKGYDCVKSFGQSTPGNCNSHMKKDEVGGIFIHYRTIESYKNESGASGSGSSTGSDGKKQYYQDIVVCSGETEALAKARITKKEGYQIWDYNIAGDARKNYSSHGEWVYTYIGYKLTTDSKKAITDIRVATFFPQSNKELYFGDVKYGCSGNLGYRYEDKTEDKDYPADLDGLWITTDDRAGTPIEFGGLHLVHDHADGTYMNENGWVPVTTFSGVPYNFASTRDSDTDNWESGRLGNAGYRYTCYQTKKDNEWNCTANYIYYEPEKKYTDKDGTKYLSALFFTFGTDSESTAAKVGETEAKFSQLDDRMKKSPNTVVDTDVNLAKSFFYKGYVVESNQKYLHLGYSWSYNPYRAFTDIKAFQGTIFTTELPYSIKKAGTAGNTAAYDAVTVISQRTTTECKWVTRGIGPENAYMSPSGLLGTNKQVPTGYTSYRPGGYSYSQDKMPFIATGLYVSGPRADAEKLTLNDIVISGSAYTASNNNGVITANLKGEDTLDGKAAEGDFNSIQEMKNPYELSPFNIAYPEWTDDENDHHDAGSPYYIYIRKPALKKKYISSITVGSFQLSDAGLSDDDRDDRDTVQGVAKQADLNAMVEANASAADEVIPANAAVTAGRAWYDTKWKEKEKHAGRTLIDTVGGWYYGTEAPNSVNDSRLPWAPPHYEIREDGDETAGRYSADYVNRPASYLSVTRTDDPDEAIKGILLYKAGSDVKYAAEKIQVDGVEYRCASVSTPIKMSVEEGENKPDLNKFKWQSERYFLYYTLNSGVAPGQPFTEITVDDNVFNSGQATALCTDKQDKVSTSADGRKTITDRAKLYGEGNLSMFIHASYEKDANMYFNKVYTANASTKKAALLKLLEQGCTEFLDMNLNEGVSKTDYDTDDKKQVGDFIYFGYRGYTLNEKAINEQPTAAAKEAERRDQMKEAVYDIVCTIGKPFKSDGIVTERYQIYYSPVSGSGGNSGVDLNAGTNGPAIYMYYTTIWATEQYNSKVGKDAGKYYSSSPEDYLKSPLTRMCFTRYDRVPYNKDSGAAASNGDDKRAWEYVLYDDYSAPVDFNDGTVKLDKDFHTENNHITMFAQRENGSVKPKGEITGGYISAKAEVGEMWLNR